MRFLMSILVIAILLSGYEAASHVVGLDTVKNGNVETASLLPCPDHHANDKPDGKAPAFDMNCHACGAFPLGMTAALQKAAYPQKTAYAPARQAFVVNGLTFPLLRPPQSLA